MILKRWFAWTCLALVLVAEVALFRSYRDRDELQTQYHSLEVQLHQTQEQLRTLQNADVGREATEIARLGKINQILTNKVAELEGAILPILQASQSNAQHLVTARLALQLQQKHLEELQSQNDQIQSQSDQIVDASAEVIAQKTCLVNLRHIDDAKQEWAKEYSAPNNAVPTKKDLLPYLKDNVFPTCPGGGVYSINAVDEVPTCSIPSHNLQRQ